MFGFLKELRPIDPFIVNFLSASWRNVTPEEVCVIKTDYILNFNNFSIIRPILRYLWISLARPKILPQGITL